MEIPFQSNLPLWEKQTKFIIFFSILSIVIVVFTIKLLGISTEITALLLLFPLVLLSIFNIEAIYYYVLVANFLYAFVSIYALGVVFAFYLPAAFLLNYKKITLEDFKHPITFPLIVYLLSVIPSFINSVNIQKSLLLSVNFFVFIAIVFVSSAALKKRDSIIRIVALFLSLTLLNGLYVVYLGIVTRERAFGFPDVIYVDCVGIAVVVSVILFVLNKRFFSKIFWGALSIFFILTSFLTQTRNIWITITLSIFTFFIFLIFKSKLFSIKRKSLVISLFLIFIVIGGIFFFTKQINPQVVERTESVTQLNQGFNQGKVENSLLMRFFIWRTAYDAFMAHPVAGIGWYAFPFSSKYYYTIPTTLFKRFVVGRTPHIAYLAVLTETGIIGFIGFLIFLFSTIKAAYVINFSKSYNEKILSVILFWMLVYVTFSMMVTDIWLWAQGIVFWGIILGLNMANRKIILSRHN